MAGKTALVLGGANTVWDDVCAALDIGEYQAVVACNDIGAAWPGRLDGWVSLHPEKFGLWLAERRQGGHPEPGQIVGHLNARSSLHIPSVVTGFTDYRFPGQVSSGSSGLFALKFALEDMACDRAVLCGVPMHEEGAHFYSGKAWGGANRHRKGWTEALPLIKGRVRSMSGWTRDVLGQPDDDWFRG